jgi:ribosomal protein S18 acetylase RimI-like enzyme
LNCGAFACWPQAEAGIETTGRQGPRITEFLCVSRDGLILSDCRLDFFLRLWWKRLVASERRRTNPDHPAGAACRQGANRHSGPREAQMTPTHDIRPLRRDDLDAACALIAATDLFPPDLLPEMAAPFLTGAVTELWLTAGQGRGLAYAAPERMTEGTWNLLLLAVHPESQRRGFGRALVRAACEALGQKGGRLLLVETSGLAGFAGARRFYSGLGFRREARIRDYYQPGDDKVIYTMPLSG